MMKVLDRLDAGLSPQIYGDGSQQYDFIYVEDVARANLCAMTAETSGKCYNVGRGIGTSIKELTELLIKLRGSQAKIEFQPAGQTFVTNRIGSTLRAEKEIGFRWRVGLEEGMRKLIEWRRADVEGVEARRSAN
jgi:UDP-glucose 4-epimerase